jgi:hypothetical protein
MKVNVRLHFWHSPEFITLMDFLPRFRDVNSH